MVIVFILSSALSLILRIPDLQCDAVDTSQVSGYYGPGSFLAFLVTLISTILRAELPLRRLFIMATGFFHYSPRDESEHSIGLDTKLFTALAWLSGAMIDFIFRSIKGIEDGQYIAAYTLTKFTVLLCCAFIPRSKYHWTDRKRELPRSLAWFFVWLIGVFAWSLRVFLYYLEPGPTETYLEGLPMVLTISLSTIGLFYLISVSSQLRHPTTDHLRPNMCVCISLSLLAVDSVLIITLEENMNACFDKPFPWQISSSKLKDMDQAAACAVAFGSILVPKFVSWINRHLFSPSF